MCPKKSDFKAIWLLAWPVMLSNISQPLLGLVDIAVIGHLPDSRYLAAVAIGTTIFSFVYWSFGFLKMGTTGMIAQTVGANDGAENRTVLMQSVILALFISTLLLVFQYPIIRLALALLKPEDIVLPHAHIYSTIRIYGAPAVLCSYVLVGWFVGNQSTKIILLLMVSTNLLNILLDILAVNILNMETKGLAIATVISEYFGLLLAIWFCRSMLKTVAGKIKYHSLIQLKAYSRIIQVNRYLFVRTILLLIAMSFFTAQGAKLGADILAANAVLLAFVMMISHVLDGFAHALEALTGRAVGSKSIELFYQFVTAAGILSLFVALGFSGFFYLFGSYLVDLLTSIEDVRTTATVYLPWLILLPLLAMPSFLLDGIFIGATKVRIMQNAMLVSVLCVYFPMWFFTQGLSNHGLWISLLSLYTARGITSVLAFYGLSVNKRWL